MEKMVLDSYKSDPTYNEIFPGVPQNLNIVKRIDSNSHSKLFILVINSWNFLDHSSIFKIL